VEHILKHAELLLTLRATGCLFIISAVESLDDAVLQKLEKSHTRVDFFRAVELCRHAGIAFQPTFLPFTPWTTPEQLLDLFEQLQRLDLVEAVAPIQLAIRLLIPAESRLLELEEVRKMLGPFDAKALVYPWKNSNAAMDRLCEELQDIVAASDKLKRGRAATFAKMLERVQRAANLEVEKRMQPVPAVGATIPHLNEPWYC
jgi:hypothetical protein